MSTKCVATMLFLTISAFQASAAVVVFSGEDLNAGPGSAHPTSSAAAASFNTAAAALGNVSLITFEGAPLGAFTNLTIAPGVSLSGTNTNGANQSILNASNFPIAPSLDGFNTTPGGTEFAEVEGGTLTFTFASPVQFFGAYFSGVQSFFTDVIQFSDGTSQTVNLPEAGTSSSEGALDFVGFTDAGKSISSITINAGSNAAGFDDIGVDDVQYQAPSVATTPEPGSLGCVMAGCVALALGYRRRRTASAVAGGREIPCASMYSVLEWTHRSEGYTWLPRNLTFHKAP